jgi:hypothetical protein
VARQLRLIHIFFLAKINYKLFVYCSLLFDEGWVGVRHSGQPGGHHFFCFSLNFIRIIAPDSSDQYSIWKIFWCATKPAIHFFLKTFIQWIYPKNPKILYVRLLWESCPLCTFRYNEMKELFPPYRYISFTRTRSQWAQRVDILASAFSVIDNLTRVSCHT